MPVSANSTGRFFSKAASRKCMSIAAAPARKARNRSTPMAMARGSPIALQSE